MRISERPPKMRINSNETFFFRSSLTPPPTPVFFCRVSLLLLRVRLLRHHRNRVGVKFSTLKPVAFLNWPRRQRGHGRGGSEGNRKTQKKKKKKIWQTISNAHVVHKLL